jgi:hypothetical protein
MDEAARRDLARAQAAEAAVARMAGDLARMAGRQPGGRRGSATLTGAPIPSSRPPVPQLAKPKPVLIPRAESAAPVRREERGPGFGEHLVPHAGTWCEVCSEMGWRNGSGHFARATVALETQHDGRYLVCGNCAARIRKSFGGEVLSARKLPDRPGPPRTGTVYRPVAFPRPDPVPWAAISDRKPNPTMEISGGGARGRSPSRKRARRSVQARGQSRALFMP